MNSIDIISHCWAGQCSIYADLLRLQIRSLVKTGGVWPDPVRLFVVHAVGDQATIKALQSNRLPSHLTIVPRVVAKEDLFRRAIMRNRLALASTADCVWFTDCDYLFTPDALWAALRAVAEKPEALSYPGQVLVTQDERAGDELIADSRRDGVGVWADPVEDWAAWKPAHYRKAIGGIQIVSGDVARRGYLDGTKWVRPVDPANGFVSCRGDKKYRNSFETQVAADIPGVYRVRHTEKGRATPPAQITAGDRVPPPPR